MKKKICICLSSDYYLKYINFKAFESLEKNFEVNYLINQRKFHNRKKIKNKKLFFYKTTRKNDTRVQRLYLIIRSRFRAASKTFDFVNEYFHPNFKNYCAKYRIDYSKLDIISKLKKILYYYLFINYKKKLIDLLSFGILFNISYKYFSFFLKQNNELKDLISKIKPNLLIYPSHLYESEVFSLLHSTLDKKTKTFYLVDNWDNLSTKTIMLEKPNHLAVWGEQTRQHAIKLHGFKKKNVHVLGNPKFDYFKRISHQKYKSYFKFSYVLFLGVREETDELGPLSQLDKEIEKNKKLYKNLKIIYRPHPYNSKNYHSEFLKLSLKNVIFDLSSNFNFYKKNTRNKGNTGSDYYLSLIKNSSFVVGGITTVVMECLLLNKKYLVISHQDKNNYLSTRNLFRSFKHFDGVDKIKNISISKNKKDLTKLFRNMFLSKNKTIKTEKELKYFYHFNNKKYSDNLLNISRKIINL